MDATPTEIRPQRGPQEQFLSTPADLAIYGGAAGGGKTFALLLEPTRHVANADFGAVIFRRESTQITNEGGLWDTALKLYPGMGAEPRIQPKLMFRFPSGAKVTFAHLNRETDVLDWQGAQIPLVCFDELTHFSRSQVFYMLSRNRSACGVRPYMRATTNPDSESWVAEFIAWWIDQDTGLPIPDRAGKLRWFVRIDDALRWADSPQELAAAYGVPVEDAKSVTFIPASVHDNPALLSRDPGYLANLKALSRVERERLLGGNWKVKPSAGMYFARHDASVIDALPADIVLIARSWDLAATTPTEEVPDPDWTAGVKLGRTASGRYVVIDVARDRKRAHDVRTMVKRVAGQDGRGVRITLPEDPGQAGKDQAESYVRDLAGYAVRRRRASAAKVERAEPAAAQWQAGNIDVLRAPWNEAFFSELDAFPDGAHDDQVDALSDAFTEVTAASSSGVAGAMSRRVG